MKKFCLIQISTVINNIILNEFEKVCSNFLLILLVCKGVKIDNNLLKQIHLENNDYLSLNINSKIIINTVLESRVFEYLKYFDGEFINGLKSKIEIIRQKYIKIEWFKNLIFLTFLLTRFLIFLIK